MGKGIKNRLAAIFEKFATSFELNHRLDEDKAGVLVGIPESGKLIHTMYTFDESEDGYEFGAALGRVDQSHQADFALEVLTSEPVRGITERIVQDRFVVLGSRNGLGDLSDVEIQRGYMDDVGRISAYFKLVEDRLGKTQDHDSTIGRFLSGGASESP